MATKAKKQARRERRAANRNADRASIAGREAATVDQRRQSAATANSSKDSPKQPAGPTILSVGSRDLTFDLGNAIDLKRFHTARKSSHDAMERFRRVRAIINKEIAGSWYDGPGGDVRSYLNKLSLSANIMAMAMAFNNPEIDVTSWNPDLWPFARRYTAAINRQIKNMDFKSTFYEATLDACVLMGVLQIQLADSGFVQTSDNQWVRKGEIWMQRVSFDDLILDLTPKDVRCTRFIGNWYRASLRRIKDRDDFDEGVVKLIAPSSKFNVDGAEQWSQEISTHYQVDDDELEPMCWLYDVYFPETHQFVTFAESDELWPLKVEEVDIGPMGPYEIMRLGLVPDNIMPSSPLHHLVALHRLINEVFGKVADQALAQKNIFATRPGEQDSGRVVMEAGNNQVVCTPTVPDQISIRGVDGPTMAWLLQTNGDIYNTCASNERALGGLGIEAQTASQEQQMLGQSSSLFAQMRAKVEDCAKNCARKIGREMWESETLTLEGQSPFENTNFFVNDTWRPKSHKAYSGEGKPREGKFDHYDFEVRVNSLGYKPPEAQLKSVIDFGQSLTVMQPLAQAGMMDMGAFAEFAAKQLNVPAIKQIFRPLFTDAATQGSGNPNQATKAPVTQRETVRNNVSRGPTGAGQGAAMASMMQGGAGGGGTATITGGKR
jgi:hypothetical protein